MQWATRTDRWPTTGTSSPPRPACRVGSCGSGRTTGCASGCPMAPSAWPTAVSSASSRTTATSSPTVWYRPISCLTRPCTKLPGSIDRSPSRLVGGRARCASRIVSRSAGWASCASRGIYASMANWCSRASSICPKCRRMHRWMCHCRAWCPTAVIPTDRTRCIFRSGSSCVALRGSHPRVTSWLGIRSICARSAGRHDSRPGVPGCRSRHLPQTTSPPSITCWCRRSS